MPSHEEKSRGESEKKGSVTRREFLEGVAAASVVSILPRHVLGGPGRTAPSDRLNVGQIGCGTQGLRQVTTGLAARDDLQFTCVCDPNADSTNYVDWSRHGIRNRVREFLEDESWGANDDGIRAGREVARDILETHYATKNGTAGYDGIRSYADFRELFENEKDLDAVVIITPDHTHATLSLAALEKGVAAISHKPVSNVLNETRRVVGTASASPVVTHMLAYRDRPDYYTLEKWLDIIGPVREVHNWTNRPVWPQGWLDRPAEEPPVPVGFDWELWLGPERHRPYHPNYTHTLYRGWYDFGGGCFADMGNYSLWAVYRLLGLDAPVSVEARAHHVPYVTDENVAQNRLSEIAFPLAGTVRFHHAASGQRPPVDIFWYEGRITPQTPEELYERGEELASEGMLFVGESGKILCGYRGTDPRLLPESLADQAPQPLDPDRIEIVDADDEWINAIRNGGKSPGGFDQTGPLAEATALYGVAMRRAGRRLDWDSRLMRFTNDSEANRFVRRDYRPGWEL